MLPECSRILARSMVRDKELAAVVGVNREPLCQAFADNDDDDNDDDLVV